VRVKYEHCFTPRSAAHSTCRGLVHCLSDVACCRAGPTRFPTKCATSASTPDVLLRMSFLGGERRAGRLPRGADTGTGGSSQRHRGDRPNDRRRRSASEWRNAPHVGSQTHSTAIHTHNDRTVQDAFPRPRHLPRHSCRDTRRAKTFRTRLRRD